MMTIEWTSIILGMLTMLSSFGWIFDRRRHKHEMEGLKADNRQKEMNLGKDYRTSRLDSCLNHERHENGESERGFLVEAPLDAEMGAGAGCGPDRAAHRREAFPMTNNIVFTPQHPSHQTHGH